LNIAVPRECLQQFENGHTKTKTPVMFWIHGQVSQKSDLRSNADIPSGVASDLVQTR
jgi:hypothetical protein